MSVDERWNKVLEDLPAIGKNSRNQQQGFNYRSIDDVLDRVNPLFAKYGVHPVPVRQQADRDQRTTAKGGILHVCYITVDWEIRSVDGDVIVAQTLGEGTDSGDKATSKAQTMAFKYLLWPSLAIATNEDPDGVTVEETVSRGSVPLFQDVAGEQIPTGFTDDPIVRTGPGGEDGTPIGQADGKKLYGVMKRKFGDDCDVPAKLSEMLGRPIKWTNEVTVGERSRLRL